MNLGDFIKKYREKKDISQRQFAVECNLSHGYISMLENNINPKTGQPITLSLASMKKIADGMKISIDELIEQTDDIPIMLGDLYDKKLFKLIAGTEYAYDDIVPAKSERSSNAVRINVYGSVPAGIPISAVEDVVDWEEIPKEWTKGGKQYIGLKVKGDSMEPKYLDGDTVIILLRQDCESGQDGVVYVNGYDCTLKKIIKRKDGILLQPLNHKYEPEFYDYNDEINPVTILGVVVEIRRKV